MAGMHPFASLWRPPDPATERRAAAALASLAAGRKVQHHLQALGWMWLPTAACLGGAPPRATCTEAGRARVATVAHEALDRLGPGWPAGRDRAVWDAAIHALSHGVFALRLADGGRWDAEPAVVDLVRRALGHPAGPARLGAVALLARSPSRALADALRARLADPLYTVRWDAVAALARSGVPAAELAPVLAGSPPHPSTPGWGRSRFEEAAASLSPG